MSLAVFLSLSLSLQVSLLNYLSSLSLPRLPPLLHSPLLLQPVTREGPVVLTPPTFPARLIKAYSVSPSLICNVPVRAGRR